MSRTPVVLSPDKRDMIYIMSTPISLSNRISISVVGDHADREVTVAGWVHAIRRQKHLVFLNLARWL